ncbi:MAG: hypothetical protein GY771_14885 [bacterium]|nr:hypothetical protein [bacterium]
MATKKNEKSITNNVNTEAPPEPRWLFYVLSGLVPIAGVVIGVIFYTKPDEENKKFGKVCLYVAVGVIAAIVALYIALIVMYIAIIVVYFIIIFIVVIFYIIIMVVLIAMGIIGGASTGYSLLPYLPEIYGSAANLLDYLC